jgi:curved DNA-binding protein CbpA
VWDEEPAGPYGRSYSDRSYGRYSRRATDTGTVATAYAHLCLTPEAPAELVKSVHHWWVRALHPDTGHGDGARMAQINAAVDVIRQHTERKAS